MEPFNVSVHLSALVDSYPSADLLIKAAINGGEQSKIAIARLWLSEGIPYAFKQNPALYESVRSWLGTRLDVDPKEISLTGSGRIGQSLAPGKLGANFCTESDLDLFIVSGCLFERMKTDFNHWSYHFEAGLVSPKNSRERRFWKDNNNRGPKLIHKGFLDSILVPNYESYSTIKNISQTTWLLKEKLDVTTNAPRVKSVSVRCYRDWGAYVRQMMISLS